MSTQLEEKLNRILSEKKEKIIPENIRAGISIFDVEGSFETLDTSDATATPSDVLDGKIAYSAKDTRIEGTYIPLDTSDATATETDILLGKTAYVNGEKLTGTYEVKGEEITITPSNVEQTEEGLFSKVTVTGDENLIPDNIKEGTEIFGVEGTAKTTNVKINDGYYLFYTNHRLDSLQEILKLCQNMTYMNYMFYNANNLTNLDLSGLDTSKVKTMSNMFYGCSNLTNLDVSGLDTSKVGGMSYMFYNCYNLTNLDLSSFNMSNVTTMSNMFFGCSNLTNLILGNSDMSKLTNMQSMFRNCKRLTNLDLSNFDISKVTDMTSMFNGCSNLTSLDLSTCKTGQVINMNNMFSGCSNLTSLDLSNLDASQITGISSTFSSCRSLTNLSRLLNLGKGYTQKTNNYSSYKLDLSSCTKLTHESLMNVINGLYDLNLTYKVSTGGTLYIQSLVLGATNLAKLTAEEIAIATNKRLVCVVIIIISFNSCIIIHHKWKVKGYFAKYL